MSLRSLKPIFLCTLLALLGACALNPFGGGDEHAETFYLDATGGFTIAYPATWKRSTGTNGAPVRWHDPKEEVTAAVTAFAPEQATGGYRRLLQDYAARHPGFTVAGEETVELASGVPALQVRGASADTAYLLYLITTRRRALVLEFAAVPERFDERRPLFREIADSFAPL